jgi:hypothetical protein
VVPSQGTRGARAAVGHRVDTELGQEEGRDDPHRP